MRIRIHQKVAVSVGRRILTVYFMFLEMFYSYRIHVLNVFLCLHTGFDFFFFTHFLSPDLDSVCNIKD